MLMPSPEEVKPEPGDTLRNEIVRLVFAETTPTPYPILVLVARPPGATAAPATGRLVSEHGPDIAVVSADDLRSLSHGDLSTENSREQSAEWLLACIAFARESHRSLLLDGQFSVAAALGAAEGFSNEGFGTRIVIAGSRRAESLLSVASLHLRRAQSGGNSPLVSVGSHDRSFEGARSLAAALEDSTTVDRVTVLGRGGVVAFDAERSDRERPFAGVSRALRGVQSERLTSLQSTQWLSELRRITEFASSLRQVRRPLIELLVDLHETAVREIIPELPVPAGSSVRTTQEQRSTTELLALRQSLAAEQPFDAAAPSITSAGPDRGGPSR